MNEQFSPVHFPLLPFIEKKILQGQTQPSGPGPSILAPTAGPPPGPGPSILGLTAGPNHLEPVTRWLLTGKSPGSGPARRRLPVTAGAMAALMAYCGMQWLL